MGLNWLPGVIGGIGGAILGGPMGAMAGYSVGAGIGGMLEGEQTNAANQQQAVSQMQFQERMANTTHQREVNDLRAAGLNPILSANAGAPAPSGAQATMTNPAENLAAGGASAAGILQKGQELKQANEMMQSNKGVNDATIKLSNIKQQTEQANARAAKAIAEQQEMNAEIQRLGQPANKAIAPYRPAIDLGVQGAGAAHDVIDLVMKGKGLQYLGRDKMPKGFGNSKGELYRHSDGLVIPKQ